MICDHATKCGDKANGCCVISRPHVCKDCHPQDGGLTFCYIAERYVRCIPHHDYDAEGRAARFQAVRFLRRTRTWTEPPWRHPHMNGLREAYRDILRAMRDARKGAK
jgi:hypothetical protein